MILYQKDIITRDKRTNAALRHKGECILFFGLTQWLLSKESTCSAGAAGNAGSIPGLGRSPRGGHGNSL